jgi:hypothetical protein
MAVLAVCGYLDSFALTGFGDLKYNIPILDFGINVCRAEKAEYSKDCQQKDNSRNDTDF